jgi:type I restriction enzyme S subunit
MMETLPKGWVTTKLENCTRILDNFREPVNSKERNKRIKGKNIEDLFPYYGATGQVGYINDFLIEGEYVLIGEDGAPFLDFLKNIAYMVNGKIWVNNHAHILESLTDNSFLYHFLNQFNFTGYVTGTTRLKLTQGKLKEIPCFFPPLKEQKRIAAKLDSIIPRIDSLKTRLNKIPTLIKRFRQSVLTAAVTGKLTEKWRDAHPEVESAEVLIERIKREREDRYKNECEVAKKNGRRKPTLYRNMTPNIRKDFDIYDLPKKWQWTDLTYVMDESRAFCYGVVQPGATVKKGNYLIRSGDLKNKSVEISGLRTISLQVDEQYKRSRLEGDEILITVVGAGIGTVSIAPLECKGYNIARAVAKVPVRDFNSQYLLLWLSTSIARSWLVGEAREVARPTLNLVQLATVLVPIPPLEEQIEIVRQVDKLFVLADKLETHYQNAKASIDKLSQSVLAKAFRGELVPQDPNDEPAEKLLERIMEEKAKMEGALKGVKKKGAGQKAKAGSRK